MDLPLLTCPSPLVLPSFPPLPSPVLLVEGQAAGGHLLIPQGGARLPEHKLMWNSCQEWSWASWTPCTQDMEPPASARNLGQGVETWAIPPFLCLPLEMIFLNLVLRCGVVTRIQCRGKHSFHSPERTWSALPFGPAETHNFQTGSDHSGYSVSICDGLCPVPPVFMGVKTGMTHCTYLS